jgi:hypothetical protein
MAEQTNRGATPATPAKPAEPQRMRAGDDDKTEGKQAAPPPQLTTGGKHGKDRLTRAGMLDRVRRGQGVIYKDRVITTEADLPSDAELAEEGGPDAVAVAEADLKRRREALENDQKRLDEAKAKSADKAGK